MQNLRIAQILSVIWIGVWLNGCMTAQQHYQDTDGAQERQMTVGTVQREIRKGMPGAEVAEVLGSPNIVTTDLKVERSGSTTRYLPTSPTREAREE